jgi:hypothetical protein
MAECDLLLESNENQPKLIVDNTRDLMQRLLEQDR